MGWQVLMYFILTFRIVKEIVTKGEIELQASSLLLQQVNTHGSVPSTPYGRSLNNNLPVRKRESERNGSESTFDWKHK